MRLFVPADTAESARAAVQCGADAVIVRLNAPNVRHGITVAQLSALAEYCRNRKVDLILRQYTPVLDTTLTDELKICAAAAKAGVNAVLTSDLGFYRAARQMLPDFPFYADVGFCVHSTGGVLAAQKLGLELAIITEELFFSELNAISLNSSIQFVVLSRNYNGNNINELKSIKKLNLLIDCDRPDDTEYVAALTELHSNALNDGRAIADAELETLAKGPLPIAAIRAGLISIERREVFPIKRPRYKGGEFIPPRIMPWEPHGLPKVNVKVKSVTQLSREIEKLNPNVVYVPVDELLLDPAHLTYFWDNEEIELCAVMPDIIRDSQLNDETEKLEQIRRLQVRSVLVSNIGHISLAERFGFKVRGSAKLAAANSQAIQQLSELKFTSCEIWKTLTSSEITPLFKFIDCEVNYLNHRRADNSGIWSVLAEFTNEGARECAGILQRISS
ncbi:MAG: U32 family peptidase [Oscillospiraceae bacterium]|jgi:collagenase-like PrtC family protease|nr:U32 family peptidase [Oscillospiraceae bacterium]